MSERALTKFKLISVALLIVGLVSAAVAVSLHRTNGTKFRHAKGFTLITKETTIPFVPHQPLPDESTYSVTTRYQRSDGTWKQVRTYYNADGQVVMKDIGYGIPGSGVFRIDKARGELDFVSSMPPIEKTSYVPIDDGHTQPNFLTDDSVAGYQTYVLRFTDQDGGYTDFYKAPELDGHTIRKVTVSSLGESIAEPLQIKMGDPDNRVFAGLPNWLVNYDHFKEKISVMEEAGKHEAAQALRRDLEEQIAKEVKEQ